VGVCVDEACVALLSADRHIGHVNPSDSLKVETILGGQLSSMEMYAQTLMAVGVFSLFSKLCHYSQRVGKYSG